MDHPDRHAELAALEALLRSPEARWATLAPVLVERVGADRLRSVVAATLQRLGGLTGVDDGSAGLRVHGPAGHVLAWAHVDATGALDGLMLAPRLQRRGLSPAAGLRVRAVVLLALFALAVLQAWRATTVGDWAADLAGESVVAVVLGGVTPWRTLPAALRAPIGALATVGAASAVRLPGLPAGDITGSALEFLLVAGLLVLVGRSRRFRWGAPGSTLSFPLRGPWYVMQGAGACSTIMRGCPSSGPPSTCCASGAGAPAGGARDATTRRPTWRSARRCTRRAAGGWCRRSATCRTRSPAGPATGRRTATM